MPFFRKTLCVRFNLLLLGWGLLLCPGGLVAQRGGGGAGSPISPSGVAALARPGGVDEKDGLKDFHQAMAVQATSEQATEFRSLVKSTEAANQQLQELLKDLEKGSDASAVSSHASTLRSALEKAQIETKKFLDGFSPAQKSGLKEVVGKVQKAESELVEQEKMLEPATVDAKAGATGIVGRAESLHQGLEKALTNFRKEQDSLGEEMGVVWSESDVAFNIPAFKTSVTIGNQPVTITTSAVISRVAVESEENVFKVEATTDLSDLQQNLTEVLSAMLDKAERCGERIAVADATLMPSAPSSVVVAQLHYERWTCGRMGGGEASNEVGEGNGTVEMKLTPAVGPNGELQILPEIGRVEADRLLADSVHSGKLGAALREKVARSLLAAVRNLKTTLPPAGAAAKMQSARFDTTPGGDLSAIVTGEMRISEEQTQLLSSQLKERLASRAVAAQAASAR